MAARRRCKLCKYEKEINFKDVGYLEKYIDRRGKLLPKAFTGNCSKHQREIVREIKRARNLALLPFTR